MGTRDTYHRTLLRACLIAGDETKLAERLEVPVNAVVDWLLGVRPVPTAIFLRSVDLVVAANRQHVESVRDFLDKVRRRHRA